MNAGARDARARRWLEGALSGSRPVGLAWIVILAFLRLTTRPGILEKPLPLERSMAFVGEWLAQPCVRAVGPGEGHCAILRKLLRDTGTAGNLTSDAHLAAMAIEIGASICSTDGDFRAVPRRRARQPAGPGPGVAGSAPEDRRPVVSRSPSGQAEA